MTVEVAAGLPPTEDAKAMWETIEEMYGKLDLAELEQGNLSITACFTCPSVLWNELEAAEEPT